MFRNKYTPRNATSTKHVPIVIHSNILLTLSDFLLPYDYPHYFLDVTRSAAKKHLIRLEVGAFLRSLCKKILKVDSEFEAAFVPFLRQVVRNIVYALYER